MENVAPPDINFHKVAFPDIDNLDSITFLKDIKPHSLSRCLEPAESNPFQDDDSLNPAFLKKNHQILGHSRRSQNPIFREGPSFKLNKNVGLYDNF